MSHISLHLADAKKSTLERVREIRNEIDRHVRELVNELNQQAA